MGTLELLFCQFEASDEPEPPGTLTFATAIVPVPGVDTPFTTIVAPVGTVATPPLTFTAFPAKPVNVCIGSKVLNMRPAPARITVVPFPERSQARPNRGAKFL